LKTGSQPDVEDGARPRLRQLKERYDGRAKFQTMQTAGFGEVLRGLSRTPDARVTNVANGGHDGFDR
jgi:hypothetical protein